MSDAEENPLEETEEYGEIEMQEEDDEEEEYPNFEGLENVQKELKEVKNSLRASLVAQMGKDFICLQIRRPAFDP